MARQTKGRLYKSGKKGAYYLQYYVSGREFKVVLKDDDGGIITREDKARIAADKVLHPVKAASKAEQLRRVRDAVETAEQKADRAQQDAAERARRKADKAMDKRASFAKGWALFMDCRSRPAACKGFPANAIPSHSTASGYKCYYERFVEWMEANHPDVQSLAEVTAEHAADFSEELKGRVAAGTHNKVIGFGKLLYRALLKDGKIRNIANPFDQVDRMKNRSQKHEPLTVEQIGRLIATATGEMKLLIAFGYFLGLRFGDAATLQWNEVDLIRGIVERVPRKTAGSSGAAVRLGIPAFLFDLLAAIPAEERSGYILPRCAEMYENRKAPQLNREVLALFKTCGIEPRQEGTGAMAHYEGKRKVYESGRARAVIRFGFHSLRFSFVSHNLDAGAPAIYVQSAAGHKNPQMTEHYNKTSDKALLAYAGNLNIPLLNPRPDAADVIDVTPTTEPEREELRHLVESLPIEKIKMLLSQTKGE